MNVTTRRGTRGPLSHVLVVLAAVLALGVAACGSSDSGGSTGTSSSSGSTGASTSAAADANKPVKLAFFGLAAENAYTQYMYKAAQEEAKKVNAEIEFFDGKFDGPTQINQMQDALTSGQFQGFIVMPNDQAGVVSVVEQAIGKGIAVTALQFPIGPDPTSAKPQVEGVTSSVIEDVVAGAKITAEGINAMCVDRDPCEAAILWGSRKVTWDGPAKRPVLMKALNPNVKIVAEADGGFLQAPGEKATDDILQAHPNLDVLATPSGDQMILGAERAIKAAGKKIGLADRPKGDIALVGYGASKAGVERVRDGQWYSTYALVPETMARKAVELTAAGARKQEVESDGLVQTEISPVGDNVTEQVLKEHPDFQAEWVG